MKGKRIFRIGLLWLLLGLFSGCGKPENSREVSCVFRAGEQYLEVFDGEQFHPVYLNGVNIGSGLPGHYPGELAIPKEDYLRWFDEIAEMNCNTIRIYTSMKPCFYEALLEHNTASEKPLYLICGLWYDEDVVEQNGDAFALLDNAVADAREEIDILHGNARIDEQQGRAWGEYTADVSPYVIGWILGIEPEARFVQTTNEKHPDLTSFDGDYLYTEDSDAFHVFLCRLGDEVIAYESTRYGMQRPLSWTNWPTADALSHPAEPSPEKEDAVEVNVERIRAKESFAAGIFASYHVYPYYPDFMYLQEEYSSFLDANGNVNTYEAYLRDLRNLHHIPVLVAEFGVPSSRGCTHRNPLTGLDQGHLTEEEQGWCLDSMARDIYHNGFAGGLVFCWQDEWFKRTWNTMDYSDPDRRAFWNDVQTSEQAFGLLEFVPGDGTQILDGNLSDWEERDVVLEGENASLLAKADARYLWLALRVKDTDLRTKQELILLDTTENSGSRHYGGYTFEWPVDFVAELNGCEDAHLYVHKYYDRYSYLYRQYDNLLDVSGYDDPGSEEFVPIWLSLNKKLYLPESGEVIDALKYETGKLRCGTADPEDPDYDSLADYCYGDGCVELRIPWGLISFRDPSTKEVEGSFWTNGGLSGTDIATIRIGFCDEEHAASLAAFTWADWNVVEYTQRLKKSYAILKDCFAQLHL